MGSGCVQMMISGENVMIRRNNEGVGIVQAMNITKELVLCVGSPIR